MLRQRSGSKRSRSRLWKIKGNRTESCLEMTTITLHVKPLSTNAAWQGRRFSTPAKKDYEAALRL